MTSPDDVLYVHEPREGFYVVGIPARDLTREDVERIPHRRIVEAVATGLYRKATRDEKAEAAEAAEKEAAKAAKEQAKAEKAAEGTER
jgi:predicted secreted protein